MACSLGDEGKESESDGTFINVSMRNAVTGNTYKAAG
jgi:hypothetical protein